MAPRWCIAIVVMGEEYDPFEEPEDEAPPAGAAGAAGGETDAPVPEKIVMKLDAGKKKAKVAAVFDVRHALRSPRRVPRCSDGRFV